MITTIEYALLAGASYYDTREDINRFPLPQNWSYISRVLQDTATGFEASAYKNALTNEIVISFAGTKDIYDTGDKAANIGLGTGYGADQLLQAAEYYLQVKAANPNANITFTGHSLGGGLAALVGVFFGVSATTFDQAPFANSAELNLLTPDLAANLRSNLAAQLDNNGNRIYSEADLSGLTDFLYWREINGGIPNSDMVTNISVQGEILSTAPLTLFDRIGTTTDEILNSSSGVSGTDLHSQALLTAFLQSKQTALTGKALNDVTFKLTDLMAMIFDSRLFYHDPNELIAPEKNLLEHLVRHEAGGVDGVQAGGDAMVTRFTSDLWKLAQDGGMTMSDGNGWNNVSKALIAFAMQMYYEDTANATNASKELFTDLSTAGVGSNGIRFDIADVSKDLNAKITAGNVKYSDLMNDVKGFGQDFQNYIDITGWFTFQERALIKSLLPTLRDWYVQAGASGMLATDTLNRGAFMLGGTGSDALVGGTGADLLVGNAGDDTLTGGGGSDVLIGGSGVDTYVWQAGQNTGIDTILDSDHTGYLRDDTGNPIVITGGDQYGDNRVFRGTDANGTSHLYTFISGNPATGGDLLVDGAMLIKNYNPNTGNHMGLTIDGPVADVNPITTRDIYGDLASDGTPDDLGNPDGVAAPGRADTLFDSAGKDHIMSYGGDDFIWAYRGEDDIIEAGAGLDKVVDTGGNNVIIGGADGDILISGAGDDRIYADMQIDVATAIAQGNSQTGTGLKGDWLTAGSGEDTLTGGTANDVLMGGAGTDLLIGGAGDDDIAGDGGYEAQDFTWTVYDTPTQRVFYAAIGEWAPAGGAADVIYAGEGNDHAWGGDGNDIIFGEGDNDYLVGDEGNDYLDGGIGIDTLYGEAGDDILIGGAGADTLYGGTGSDIYIFNRGDGGDTVYDTQADNNIFRFGAGINSSDITLNLGSLKLNLGNGDEIHIAGFNQNDVFNSSSISGFDGNDRMLGAVNDACYAA